MDTELIKIILAFVVLINPFSALGLFLPPKSRPNRLFDGVCGHHFFYHFRREFAKSTGHLGGVVSGGRRGVGVFDCH